MGGRRESTPIMNSDLVGRGIPHNTIRSEKNKIVQHAEVDQEGLVEN